MLQNEESNLLAPLKTDQLYSSMEELPKFLNSDLEIAKHGAQLPHWQQDHSTYFLTFRLADSIPHAKLEKWKEERSIWLDIHPRPWSELEERDYHSRFSDSIERWLDAGEGACVLRDRAAAGELQDALLAKNEDRYVHHAFVVMPNHVHALVSLGLNESLEGLLKIWKGVSSRKINLLSGRSGELWQPNYFDRLIRDSEHFWNCARYIRRNPEKAKLREGCFLLHESNFVKRGLDLRAQRHL